MPQEHPITPPPELIHEWQIKMEYTATRAAREALVTKVFQLGADQELDACCEYIQSYRNFLLAEDLRDARRPKPPSLKEQALALINHDPENQPFLSEEGIAIIRRALESLPS